MRIANALFVNRPSDSWRMSGPISNVVILFASIATGSLALYALWQLPLIDLASRLRLLALLTVEVWATSDE